MIGQLAVDTREQGERCDTWLDELPPSVSAVLRDYQRDMIAGARDCIRRGVRRILIQAPTGAGKTHCIASIVSCAVEAGMRVLILATRTRLVRQIHERLDEFEIPHGIVAASMPGYINWSRPVQVASVDTLHARCMRELARMPLPIADVVIFDESHLALGDTRRKILEAYSHAWIFGFTATPAKTSGAPLKDGFDEMVLGPATSELIAKGMLVKPRVYNQPVITERELSKVTKDAKTGDYATGALSKVMSRPKLVGDVVQNWLRIANGKRTLVFACDKGHGAELLTSFRTAGVPAEMLTDNDDDASREETIARLERGDTHVVINCFLLSYGIDIPAVEAVVLARPTKSIVLYLQAVGRAMRPAPGKDMCLVIDHGRVVETLGPPAYDREWSLADGNYNKAAVAKVAAERKQTDQLQRHCIECHCEWLASEEGNNCPSCGWQFVPKAKPVQVQQAELVAGKDDSADWKEMDAFHAEACQWYANRWPDRWQAKPASGRFWAWSQTRKKFKRPDDERIPRRYWEHAPRPPGAVTDGYLKSQQIAWAAKQKSERGRAA